MMILRVGLNYDKSKAGIMAKSQEEMMIMGEMRNSTQW